MTKLGTSVLVLLLVVVAGAGFLIFKSNNTPVNNSVIISFEECAKAGYPVMESYPRQCRVPDGELFVESVTNPNPVPVVKGGCFVGGCSTQICSDQEGVVSTCEYREEYACYKTATCERQASGQCGWTQTESLSSCLSSPSRIAAGYVAGHVTIGPFCPVERVDDPCKIPPEAYSSREVIVYEDNKTTVKEKGKIDTEGNYKIALNPGKYFVQIKPAGIGEGEKKSVIIKSFEITTVNFDIDTGIR